ncbi:ATP-grasp domain-containing protein [Ancylomarina sp. 16SWW S1-10-2]|uniref:D-alanine--D-alanine ligase family protein n=1 Tax=Ancylomarina sp. 16SWW S1-10-2 TaxID=2499681 RepID=UPI0012AE3A48|nr:ATP-grasp domain-containing protein [Ancylomarina sp. 16SWW S1-10-2]MRT92256.1 ATP-grasp domain-containing protein [Ancylomarina sp. 16SWW S1-10-2]
MKKVTILHNRIENNTADELDVLDQKELVRKACSNLGYEVETLTVGDHIKNDLEIVASSKPDMVFNLVEATWGKGELIYFAPAILNSYKIPYTGIPLDALFVTTNKVLAKKMMLKDKLPTAPFFAINEIHLLDPQKIYIIKPIWEEGSVGILEELIFTLADTNKINIIKGVSVSQYFIEEFIEGREFNISILAGENGPEVLPPAEMIFSEYFNDKPKIVGYKAKWDEDSEEYKHTNRSFGTLDNNPILKKKLVDICTKSWKLFNLHGYVRIDFRLDEWDNPYILEVNGNPCIAPDSGFIAASEYAGYSRTQIIERILNDLN